MNYTDILRYYNISDNETPFDYAYYDADSLRLVKDVSYLYISPLIISIGVFGDLMNVLVLSHPVLRKTSVVYSYLLALSVTDLLAHFSVIPMLLWILGYRLCTKTAAFYYAHFGFPLANAFMGASVWIVVFITLGQYIAVCHPFVQTFRSKRICFFVTASAYVFSFAVYVPWMWKKRVVFDGGRQCEYAALDDPSVINTLWYHAYQLTRETISRFVPFLFIVYFNVRIMLVYRRSKTHRLSVVGEHQKLNVKQKTEREERRLWYLLLAVMTIFFVCTLPAAVITILVSDKYERNLHFQIIRSVSNILEFTKFALNFYLYCMINPDIRRLFLRRCTSFLTICCCCCTILTRTLRYRSMSFTVIDKCRSNNNSSHRRNNRPTTNKTNDTSTVDNNSNYSYTLCTNGDGFSGYYSFRNVKRKPAILKGSRQTLSALLMDEDQRTAAYKINRAAGKRLSSSSSARVHRPVERKISEPLGDYSNKRPSTACRKTVSFKERFPSMVDEEDGANSSSGVCRNNTGETGAKRDSQSGNKMDHFYYDTPNLSRDANKANGSYNSLDLEDSFFGFYETKV